MIIAFFTIPRITILAPFGAYIAFWEAAGGRPKETGADGRGAAGGAEERQAGSRGDMARPAGGCGYGETPGVRKACRPGTGTIRGEHLMRSPLSVPQTQCMKHFVCPGLQAFRAPGVSSHIRRCPPARAMSPPLPARRSSAPPAAPHLSAPVSLGLVFAGGR